LDVFAGGTGGHLQRWLFGWIRHRRARLILAYTLSIAVAISAAFVLREVSLALTTHITLPEQKTAALSFLSGDDRELRDTVKSAEGAEEV
jgi:biotin transporter BioY